MRPDVKFGLVFSMVIVFVAGGYYLYRDSREVPIPVEPDTKKLAEATKPKAQPPVTPRSSTVDPGASRPVNRAQPRRETRGAEPSGNQRLAAQDPNRPRGSAYPAVQPAVTRPGVTPEPVPEATKTAEKTTDPAVETSTNTSQPVSPSGTPGERVVASKPVVKQPTPVETARRSVPLVGTKPGSQPANAPAPGRPDDVAVDLHRVQAGDTLSSLASLYYGSERYTQFLIDSNDQLADPNRLKIGETVRIPSRPAETVSRKVERSQPAPEAKPDNDVRTYRVQPGDSFYKIAQDALGDSSRWKELFELNRDRVGGDPTKLQVGQEIVLPKP